MRDLCVNVNSGTLLHGSAGETRASVWHTRARRAALRHSSVRCPVWLELRRLPQILLVLWLDVD